MFALEPDIKDMTNAFSYVLFYVFHLSLLQENGGDMLKLISSETTNTQSHDLLWSIFKSHPSFQQFVIYFVQ